MKTKIFLALTLGSLALFVDGCEKHPPVSEATGKGVPTARRKARGKVLYLHYCAFCHGEEGKGDGLNAYNLKVKPRSLDAAFLSEKTDEELLKVISQGGRKHGFSPLMPSWGLTLKTKDIENILTFLRYRDVAEIPDLWKGGSGAVGDDAVR